MEPLLVGGAMSVLFWVTIYTLVLVPLFFVARPLLGDKTRQATPVILVVLLIPLLVLGLHKYSGVSNVAVADSSSGVFSLTSQEVSSPKLNREQISAAELPIELLYSDDCALILGLQLQRIRTNVTPESYIEMCIDAVAETDQNIIAGR